jgi:hypothetical protein
VQGYSSLAEMARRYRSLAAYSPRAFAEYAAALMRSYCEFRVGNCRRLLDTFDAEPPYWAASVRAHIAALEEAYFSPCIPDGLQRHIANYGALLEAWPALFKEGGGWRD